MDNQEFNDWGKDVDKVFYAQIVLDKMKKSKRFKRKDLRIIEGKIKRLRYKTHIRMFQDNPIMQERVAITNAKEWKKFFNQEK